MFGQLAPSTCSGAGLFCLVVFFQLARCSIVAGRGLTCDGLPFQCSGHDHSPMAVGRVAGARDRPSAMAAIVYFLVLPLESIAISSTFRAARPNNQIGPPASPTLRVSNRNDAECPCHRDVHDLAYGQAERRRSGATLGQHGPCVWSCRAVSLTIPDMMVEV